MANMSKIKPQASTVPRVGSQTSRNISNYKNTFPVKIFTRHESGELIGGLLGETYWRWLYVNILWVHVAHRHAGFRTRLMSRAETETFHRGRCCAYLETLDFQAPDFYRRLGYSFWGVLDDFPPGHRRIFMLKDFSDVSLDQLPWHPA